jgi:hypothetical protein
MLWCSSRGQLHQTSPDRRIRKLVVRCPIKAVYTTPEELNPYATQLDSFTFCILFTFEVFEFCVLDSQSVSS